MLPETTIVDDPIDVHRRLAELGLSLAPIHNAILAGELARNSCTPNDPPTAPGYLAWARSVRGLREELVQDGFTRSDKGGYSTVVSPDRAYEIAVSTGDDGTGDSTSPSSTKYPKGPRTAAAAAKNAQKFLFDIVIPGDDDDPEITYILLVARSEEEIRCELSVPGLVAEGYVVSWSERIILPSISLLNDPERHAQPEDDADDLDIDITRRSGQ